MKRKVIIEVEAVVEFNEFDVQEKNIRDNRFGMFFRISDFLRGHVMKRRGLKNIGCHYISNKAARKACPSLATVDQFGAAYTDQHVDEIALIENDSNRDDEKYTIVHELLHFVLGS